MKIRELKREDEEELTYFFCSLDTATERVWNHLQTDPETRASLFLREDSDKIVAIENGRIVGFAYLVHDKGYEDKPSLGMVVRPTHRKRGIGSALMTCLFDIEKAKGYKGIYLTTYKTNLGALEFYLKHGFKIIGEDDLRWRMEHG